MNWFNDVFKFIYIFFTMSLLVSCVPEKGPVILNKREQDILISVSFSNGHEVGGLLPAGRTFWLGYDDAKISSINVHKTSKELLFELGEEELSKWQPNEMKLLVIFVDGTGIRKATEQELRKERKKRSN